MKRQSVIMDWGWWLNTITWHFPIEKQLNAPSKPVALNRPVLKFCTIPTFDKFRRLYFVADGVSLCLPPYSDFINFFQISTGDYFRINFHQYILFYPGRADFGWPPCRMLFDSNKWNSASFSLSALIIKVTSKWHQCYCSVWWEQTLLFRRLCY